MRLVEAQLQIIIQSVILYTITFENAIDMSSLLYSDTTSKVTYFLLLLSSILSTCISFTKMLLAGNLPVLSSVFSIRAVIVFVFITFVFIMVFFELFMMLFCLIMMLFEPVRKLVIMLIKMIFFVLLLVILVELFFGILVVVRGL